MSQNRTKPATSRGRGATANPTGRFEPLRREAAWDDPVDMPPLRTTVTRDSARTMITRNRSPDVPFDRSVNPYRGCEHGCIYCYARPSHAHLGLSPGLDFESRLFAKTDGPALLEAELRRPGYRPTPLALGANTDPWQPVERDHGVTRGMLEVLTRFHHPVLATTKGAAIVRDIDLFAELARQDLVRVLISITTLDRGLARRLEPRAASPDRRLAAIRSLAEAGVPVGVMVAPIIPGLTDPEIERILTAARDHGASAAGMVFLRLPGEVADLFTDWLDHHYPDRASRVTSLLRQSRGGGMNDSAFDRRMVGSGPFARLIGQRFDLACRRLGLDQRSDVHFNLEAFQPPPRPGDQLSLF